jgi:hypothetical protein
MSSHQHIQQPRNAKSIWKHTQIPPSTLVDAVDVVLFFVFFVCSWCRIAGGRDRTCDLFWGQSRMSGSREPMNK